MTEVCNDNARIENVNANLMLPVLSLVKTIERGMDILICMTNTQLQMKACFLHYTFSHLTQNRPNIICYTFLNRYQRSIIIAYIISCLMYVR